jgi:hypothetical protein
MTHEQVTKLFGRFRKASTWPTKNPRVFHFHRDSGGEYTVDLYEDMERLVIFGCHWTRYASMLNEPARLILRMFTID